MFLQGSHVKISIVVSFIVAGSFLSGCSNSSTPSRTPAEQPQLSAVESLYGSWATDCSIDGDGTAYRYSEWTFSATAVTATGYNYAATDTQCASPTDSISRTFEPTYLADTQDTSLGAAIKTDLIIVASTLTEGAEVVWDSATDGIPPDITTEYSLFIVSDNRLYGPDFSTGDATTPQTRPTNLNTSFGLRRLP